MLRDGDLPVKVPLQVAEWEPWVSTSRAICAAVWGVHVISLVLASSPKVHHPHDPPGPEREALLPRADLRRGEVPAHRVHAHRGTGLPALRPDLPQTPVSGLGPGLWEGPSPGGESVFPLALLAGTLEVLPGRKQPSKTFVLSFCSGK